jgi:DNA-binding beta-propeller fold protein YncE
MTCCALIQMAILDAKAKYAYAPLDIQASSGVYQGFIYRINVQLGCSGLSIPSAFTLGSTLTLGSCPSDSTVRPYGFSCQLGCASGYSPGSGGLLTCSASYNTWTGVAQICYPNTCTLPALPTGVAAGTCTSPSLATGTSCTFTLASGYALTFGSLTVTCDIYGLTQMPTTSISSCALATLPPGTLPGRCDSSRCYLNPAPGYTLRANTLATTCSAGSYTGTYPIMTLAEYGRHELIVAPLYNTPTNGFNSPQHSAIDSTSTWMYVTDYNNGHVWKVNIAMGTYYQVDLYGTTLVHPYGIALDEAGGVLYVTDTSLYNVYKITIASGLVGPPIIPSIGTRTLRGVVFDRVNSKLYIAESYCCNGGYHVLSASLLDGTTTVLEVAFSFSTPWALTLTNDSTTLYVADYSNGHVYSLSIATRIVTRIDAVAFTNPVGIQLDQANNRLLVTDNVRSRNNGTQRKKRNRVESR